MWKSLTARRHLRRRSVGQDPDAGRKADIAQRDNPFADLMAKLDQIPYPPRRGWKPVCDH